MSLSERIRPHCEAAPWVCEEVKQLESRLKQLESELAEAQALHRWAVKERDYERGHVTTLRSVIAAELEAKRLLIADADKCDHRQHQALNKAREETLIAYQSRRRLVQEISDFLDHALDQGWIDVDDESQGIADLREAIEQARKETP